MHHSYYGAYSARLFSSYISHGKPVFVAFFSSFLLLRFLFYAIFTQTCIVSIIHSRFFVLCTRTVRMVLVECDCDCECIMFLPRSCSSYSNLAQCLLVWSYFVSVFEKKILLLFRLESNQIKRNVGP